MVTGAAPGNARHALADSSVVVMTPHLVHLSRPEICFPVAVAITLIGAVLAFAPVFLTVSNPGAKADACTEMWGGSQIATCFILPQE
jgi:hypothetical protein